MQESFVLFNGNDHGTSLLKIRFLDRHVVLVIWSSRQSSSTISSREAFSHGSPGFSRPVPVMHFDGQIGDSIKIRERPSSSFQESRFSLDTIQHLMVFNAMFGEPCHLDGYEHTLSTLSVDNSCRKKQSYELVGLER